MGRGFAWAQSEEVAACRAALRVGERPIVGASQKKEALEQRMRKEFLTFIPDDATQEGRARWMSRAARAIGKQRKNLRAACIKMRARAEVVRASDLSGDPSKGDMWRAALLLRNGKGELSDAYQAISDKPYDIGPKLPREGSYKHLDKLNALASGALGVAPKDAASSPSQFPAEELQSEVKDSDEIAREGASKKRQSKALSRPMGSKKAKAQRGGEKANMVRMTDSC